MFLLSKWCFSISYNIQKVPLHEQNNTSTNSSPLTSVHNYPLCFNEHWWSLTPQEQICRGRQSEEGLGKGKAEEGRAGKTPLQYQNSAHIPLDTTFISFSTKRLKIGRYICCHIQTPFLAQEHFTQEFSPFSLLAAALRTGFDTTLEMHKPSGIGGTVDTFWETYFRGMQRKPRLSFLILVAHYLFHSTMNNSKRH